MAQIKPRNSRSLEYLAKLEGVLGENSELNALVMMLKSEIAHQQISIEEVAQLKHSHSNQIKTLSDAQANQLEEIERFSVDR